MGTRIAPITRETAAARMAQRLLIVEDCPSLASSLFAMLSGRVAELCLASSVAAATRSLQEFSPDLVLLDVALPDGTGLDVLHVIQGLCPAPAVVAMSGSASPQQGFSLAELAVRAYLPKPITFEALEAAIDKAMRSPPSIAPHLRALVGRRSLSNVEDEVRETMVREALAKGAGSRRRAAGVLSISRQLLQHILRKSAP